MIRSISALRCALLLTLMAAAPGCLAVAAGAGAAGAVAWTNRGASSVVQGSVDQVFQRSAAVFGDLAISRTGESTQDQGRERTLVGRKNDMEVTVEIERETDSTSKVEVYTRKNTVEWDRDYSRDVLTRIINRS